jgi:hypothetical protein
MPGKGEKKKKLGPRTRLPKHCIFNPSERRIISRQVKNTELILSVILMGNTLAD